MLHRQARLRSVRWVTRVAPGVLFCLPVVLSAQAGPPQAGRSQIVPVTQEPHHRIVYQDARLRVLDVDIPSGATTLDHRHDDDLLFISVGPADTRTRTPETDWGPQRPRRPLGEVGTVDYSGQPGVHTIQTLGKAPYLLIAVENLKMSGWVKPPPLAGPGVTTVHESRSFRASSIALGAATAAVTRRHLAPTVVVLVTGQAEVTRNQQSQSLSVVKRWAVVPEGESFAVGVRPGGAASLVEVEVH